MKDKKLNYNFVMSQAQQMPEDKKEIIKAAVTHCRDHGN